MIIIAKGFAPAPCDPIPAPVKVLMITHFPIDTVYGAGVSLRLHFKSFELSDRFQFTLISPKSLIYGNLNQMTDSEIMKKWPSVRDVYHFVLPYRFNNDYSNYGEYRRLKNKVRQLLAFISRRPMIEFIKRHRPDIIHLSSLVLAPLALWFKRNGDLCSIPVVGHVREFLQTGIADDEITEIEAMDAFICIEAGIRNRLLEVVNVSIPDELVKVIMNPFHSSLADPDPVLFGDVDYKATRVFAIVGQITAGKGVKKVCEAFLRAELSNAVLLVVGRPNGTYGDKVKTLCLRNRKKLKWLGQQPALLERGFFNAITAVVRGDPTFAIGRTGYEALFSGASAILPGVESDMSTDHELRHFRDRVVFYKPMDMASLIEAFESFRTSLPDKVNSREHISLPNSNLGVYAQRIQELYNRVLRINLL